MIVVTGAAGFIGSCLISALNRAGYKDIIAVDKFDKPAKNLNLIGKAILHRIDRDEFFTWSKKWKNDIDFIFHLGARTDTLESSSELFDKLNLNYSKQVWKLCSEALIPIIYASSAATYGDGKYGFTEELQTTEKLVPLNKYAESKHQFDLWVIQQDQKPPSWTGLKFFNVFGPNEYHKGNMASMVYQAFIQIKKTGMLGLFKSYRTDFTNGAQRRDFIYVKDIVNLSLELMESRRSVGLLNVGTGNPISFNYLAKCIFTTLKKPEKITYIDMPIEIREKYQYSTQASTTKLTHEITYPISQQIDSYINDYVSQYLEFSRYY